MLPEEEGWAGNIYEEGEGVTPGEESDYEYS